MNWTAIAISNTNRRPESWLFDGPENNLEAYDMARVMNPMYFVVCVVPGSHTIDFSYESVSMFLVENNELLTPEVDGVFVPKFHTRTLKVD